MAKKTTTTAESAQEQMPCHLRKLPVELRLIIYDLGFQDVVETITTPLAIKKFSTEQPWSETPIPKIKTFSGVISLLHASRALRSETIEALAPLTKPSLDIMEARFFHEQEMIGQPRTMGMYYRVLSQDLLRDTSQVFEANRHYLAMCALHSTVQLIKLHYDGTDNTRGKSDYTMGELALLRGKARNELPPLRSLLRRDGRPRHPRHGNYAMANAPRQMRPRRALG